MAELDQLFQSSFCHCSADISEVTDRGLPNLPEDLEYCDLTRCFKVKTRWKSKAQKKQEEIEARKKQQVLLPSTGR